MRKVIILDAMSKKKSKIAPLFEIQPWCIVSEDFGTINGQLVGVHTLTKGKQKLDTACISRTIRAIFKLFLFDITPNLLTLHTPQWNNPNK